MQTGLVLERWAIETAKSAVLWPVWWYTKGLALVAGGVVAAIRGQAKSISITVWVKNLFVPMYGLHDWQSRLISFVARTATIAGKGFMLGVWSLVMVVALLVYIAFPVALVAAIVMQFI
jgi:hypothetical protein